MSTADSRILVSALAFPPSGGGTSVLLFELFKHLPPGRFVVVHGPEDSEASGVMDLGIERKAVLVANSARLTGRCARRWPALYTWVIRRQLEREARKHRVSRIYAHYPNACFLMAGWQTAEKLGLPLTVYFDILWEESVLFGKELARRYEQRILQRADSRFAITEFAAEHLQRKHGVPVALMPHTLGVEDMPSGLTPLPAEGPVVIHFAGGIYPMMNGDAVVRLAQALGRCRTRATLDIYSRTPAQELQRLGLQAQSRPRSDVLAAQRRSAILYLPQAFESASPVMIRNNLPTKCLEYLKSGRPILVHSPADSYLSYLARREGFALVVDKPDAAALSAAVDELAVNRELQSRLVDNALRFARSRESGVWARSLWAALDG